MKRAIKVKLFPTKTKKRKLIALIQAYRKAVNFYIRQIVQNTNCKLDKETLALLKTSKLSERYKSNALKQALGICKGCRKTRKKVPKFTGHPILDAKFITIAEGHGSFDLYFKISVLAKRKPIYVPSKKTSVYNKWIQQGNLIQGCELHSDYAIIWIDCLEVECKSGDAIGIDIGMNKLIVTSEGQFIGEGFKELNDKILKTKKNTKARKKALRERDNYFNECVNQLPWDRIGIFAYENLKNLVKGKKGRRKKKSFRVRQKHWAYRKLISRLLEKCEENRVRPVYVNPKNTSCTCPACGNVDARNRKDELFNCLTCGHEQDADLVGAINVLNKALRWIEESRVPQTQKVIIN